MNNENTTVNILPIKTTIKKTGYSHSFIVPAGVLKTLGLFVEDSVELERVNEQIVIRNVRLILTLQELFQGFEPAQ